MKTKLFYIILLTIFIGGCFAEQNYFEPAVYYEKKDYYFGLGTSVGELINILGEPQKKELVDDEKYKERYFWQGLKISSDNKNDIIYISISSTDYSIRGIKVGDSLSRATTIFKDEGYNNKKYQRLDILMTIEDKLSYVGIGFKYDESNIINEIIIYFTL